MSIDELKNNYKKRWDIETHFKELKYKTSIGKITSKTENTVLQELYINNLIYILNSYFKKIFIDEILLQDNDKYKINNSFSINTLFKDILKILFFEDLNKKSFNTILKYIIVVTNVKYYIQYIRKEYERVIKGPVNNWKLKSIK